MPSTKEIVEEHVKCFGARDLKGILPRPKRKLSLGEMDRTIRDAAVDRSKRRR